MDMSKTEMRSERSEKKIFLKFILIMIAATIGGAVLGMIGVNLDSEKFIEVCRSIPIGVSKAVFAIFLLENLIFFGLSLKKYLDAAKIYRQSSDDDACDDVERMLDYPMLYSNIALVINFMMFSLCVWCSDRALERGSEKWFFILSLGGIAVFVFSMVWEMLIQFLVVKLVKEMNPEKKGSIFEMNFQKKWEESSDEGQKLILYKSGYKAFVRMRTACIIMWMIAFLSQMFLKTGVLPVIIVCIIFLIGIVSFTAESMRLEHPKN